MTNYAHHGTGVGSHADVATKYERSFQAIKQFSMRNAAEIQVRRRELQGELAAETTHLWVGYGNPGGRARLFERPGEWRSHRCVSEDELRSRLSEDGMLHALPVGPPHFAAHDRLDSVQACPRTSPRPSLERTGHTALGLSCPSLVNREAGSRLCLKSL